VDLIYSCWCKAQVSVDSWPRQLMCIRQARQTPAGRSLSWRDFLWYKLKCQHNESQNKSRYIIYQCTQHARTIDPHTNLSHLGTSSSRNGKETHR
jgi:hypothetical protein